MGVSCSLEMSCHYSGHNFVMGSNEMSEPVFMCCQKWSSSLMKSGLGTGDVWPQLNLRKWKPYFSIENFSVFSWLANMSRFWFHVLISSYSEGKVRNIIGWGKYLTYVLKLGDKIMPQYLYMKSTSSSSLTVFSPEAIQLLISALNMNPNLTTDTLGCNGNACVCQKLVLQKTYMIKVTCSMQLV
jgi:hypothetical protein